MDISVVPEIQRKRKIQYNKVKGRLSQRVSNFLNRSVCHENIQKQGSGDKCNESQLVSVKNINAFLEKNRDLAKALQDTRCQMQELEKQKITSQLECIEMREKLNITTNAILKCECKQSDASTSGLLNKVKFSISQSSNLFAEYMDSLAVKKAITLGLGCKVNVQQIGVQTEVIQSTDVNTQTEGIPPAAIPTKNKKIQVCSDSNHKHCSIGVFESKATQSEYICTKSKMVQCSLLDDSSVGNNKSLNVKLKKTEKRTPLQPINLFTNANQQNSQPLHSNLKINETKYHSILKPNNTTKTQFKIYEDNEGKPDKNNKEMSFKKDRSCLKKVTIHSPAQVFRYDEIKEIEGERLRSRKNRPIYTEVAMRKKLRKSDKDVKFYYSPALKKAKRKRKKSVKNVIPLELIISLVEESLLL